MIKPLIHIHQLSFAWDQEPVLEDVDLKIFDNDFIGMIGPNGGGKTTLIKIILGLVQPLKGKIYFREDLRSGKRPIGYLPQMKQLDKSFPITVLDVVRVRIAHAQRTFYRQGGRKGEGFGAVERNRNRQLIC